MTALMYRLTALVLFVAVGKGSFAQNASPDTAGYRQGVEAAVATYHQALGTQAELYNGPEHVRYLPTIEGIPYYQVDEWQKAAVEYRGVLYRDVPVRYDLVTDKVIVGHPNGYQAFSLFSPRVASFTLGGSYFIYLPADSAKGAPPAGFYQVLARGAVTVLARRSKRIEEKLQERTLHFVTADRYYMLRDGRYYSPRNQRELLELAGEHKREARQALHQQHLRYRKHPEEAIMTVARLYNH